MCSKTLIISLFPLIARYPTQNNTSLLIVSDENDERVLVLLNVHNEGGSGHRAQNSGRMERGCRGVGKMRAQHTAHPSP